MKQGKLFILASVLLLGSCATNGGGAGESTGSNDKITSSETSVTSSSTGGDVNPANAKFTLVMNGDLRLNQSRSIYAILKEGVTGNVVFESSDPSVIRTSKMEGVSNEALLTAVSEGEAIISAYLEGEENVIVSKTLTISHGTALSSEVFNQLTGAMKVDLTQTLYDYDSQLKPTLHEQSDITTIYEEVSEMDSYHNTDAYQITVKNHKTQQVTYERKYVRNGVRLATEFINKNNEIGKLTLFDDEGEEYNWVNSYYENLFKFDENTDAQAMVTASDFESFDGGKTYFYVGKNLWSTTYLACSLVLQDITPDEFAITVDGDSLGIYFVTDPFGKDGVTSKGGQVVEGKISEIGTAKIEHMQPYAHETYHDALEVARAEIANSKNYTATYSINGDDGKTTYTMVYTDDTIEEKIVDSSGKIIAHDGARKNGTGYFTYTYDDKTGTLTKTKDYVAAWDSVNRYPTFDFAVEILGPESNGAYPSRGENTGSFLSYCWNLPKYAYYYTVDGSVSLTLKEGHFASMKGKLTSSSLNDTIEFSGEYSKIGSTTLDYDWSSLEDKAEPSEYPAVLLASLKEWGVDQVVPYLYPTNTGYKDSTVAWSRWKDASGVMDSNYSKYVAFRTNEFETTEQRDAYLAKYKELLVSLGWKLTNEKDENMGYLCYVDSTGEWKLSVGENKNYFGGSATKGVLFTITNKNNKLATPSSYFD